MKRDAYKLCFAVLAALLVLLLIAPLIVNALFVSEAPCDFLRARFGAGDLLGYLGSVLVGVGSVALARYAILQTDRIDKVEQEMRDRQDRFERENTKRPYFVVGGVLLDEVPIQVDEMGRCQADGVSDTSTVSVIIDNIGDGPACRFRTREDSAFGKPPVMGEHRLCVAAGASYELNISIREIGKTGSVATTFKYENIVGCLYSQRIDVRLISVPIYSPLREEIESGLFADMILDESQRLMVSSLTPQSVERHE